MADVVDTATRSRMMAGIRSRNTKPEVALRSALHRLGLRFRIHDGKLPGRPDIVFPRHRAAVQVHGCFWHRHEDCRYSTTPASNREFWTGKFLANVERDAKSRRALEDLGWRTAVVWECSLRKGGEVEVADSLRRWLESTNVSAEFPEGRTGFQARTEQIGE